MRKRGAVGAGGATGWHRSLWALGLLRALSLPALGSGAQESTRSAEEGTVIPLPTPRPSGPISVEAALADRRSLRDYSEAALDLSEVAQLLWAAQGVNGPDGRRTAPSAGALYPLEVLLVAGQVDDLAASVYRYQPAGHSLKQAVSGDQRVALARACLEQMWMSRAPAMLLIAAVPERTRRRYGQRSGRYVAMEVGHAAQNVCLQAAALGLGTCAVGAFEDAQVARIAGLGEGEEPLLLLPVGREP